MTRTHRSSLLCFSRPMTLPSAGPLAPAGIFMCSGLSIPGHASCACPRSSVAWQGRNLHLLSIGYVFRPRLRPRLPQGRSALPWNPWIFGLKDSYFHLATRSGILSPHKSTRPYDRASSLCRCSPTNNNHYSKVSAARFSPGHFRRRASRLVSCYALFERMAASEPTS